MTVPGNWLLQDENQSTENGITTTSEGYVATDEPSYIELRLLEEDTDPVSAQELLTAYKTDSIAGFEIVYAKVVTFKGREWLKGIVKKTDGEEPIWLYEYLTDTEDGLYQVTYYVTDSEDVLSVSITSSIKETIKVK